MIKSIEDPSQERYVLIALSEDFNIVKIDLTKEILDKVK